MTLLKIAFSLSTCVLLIALTLNMIATPFLFRSLYRLQTGATTPEATNQVQLILETLHSTNRGFLQPLPTGLTLSKPEAQHMHDVKRLLRLSQLIVILFLILSAALLYLLSHSSKQPRIHHLANTFLATTGGVCSSLIVSAVSNWEWFFDSFHRLLFAENTWLFPATSTLITLFPEDFWQFMTAIVVITFLGLIGITYAALWWLQTTQIQPNDKILPV